MGFENLRFMALWLLARATFQPITLSIQRALIFIIQTSSSAPGRPTQEAPSDLSNALDSHGALQS
jgi:hypothetical protein